MFYYADVHCVIPTIEIRATNPALGSLPPYALQLPCPTLHWNLKEGNRGYQNSASGYKPRNASTPLLKHQPGKQHTNNQRKATTVSFQNTREFPGLLIRFHLHLKKRKSSCLRSLSSRRRGCPTCLNQTQQPHTIKDDSCHSLTFCLTGARK